MLTESLETPIADAGDVLVVGAGSAGITAAICAARNGARTTLVDPAGVPGGTLISGLPLLGCHDGERQVVRGIFDEIVSRLRDAGAVHGDPGKTTCLSIDHEQLKLILLEMLAEAGVELRLHTLFVRAAMDDAMIHAAVVEGKGSRLALQARIYIDATGDADVAISAGVPVEKGRSGDGGMQSMTLMFGVANIDEHRFAEWGGYERARELYLEVAAREDFRNPRRSDLSGFWHAPNRHGEVALNVTRVLNADGSDAASLTAAEIDGRLQASEFLNRFLKPHVGGFEEAYISWTAAKIGVRETRRVIGEYVLTEEDLLSFRKFSDTVVCGSYPIDIHSPDGDGTRLETSRFYGGRYWTIPYRCLVPLHVDNLLIAGRCLSATHEALSAVRVMANTLAMGQAAGTAAALSALDGTPPRRLDVALLQNTLLAEGAYLGDFDRDAAES